MIERGPNLCLLGHVTGLLVCLYLKLSLSSIFKPDDFRSYLSCFVLDIELTDKSFIRELGVFIDGKFQGYSFCPPQKYKPTKQAFWRTRNLHRNVWNSGRWDYNELVNILPRDLRGEYFAKRTKNFKTLGNSSQKAVEKLEDLGCLSKFKISLRKKCGVALVTESDTRPHFTLQSARWKCSVIGYCGI